MSHFQKAARELLDDEEVRDPLKTDLEIFGEYIPEDPAEFYKDFGFLIHPDSGKDVTDLAWYQYLVWKSTARYRLVIKSQKVGVSTSALLEDFQKALTSCRGKDILIIAQTAYHAHEHLRSLKSHIMNSDKYRKYLIVRQSEMLFKEEKSKVGVAYIRNQDNRYRPTRIIALGASEGSVWSWKDVKHIHMSDIAAADLVDDSGLFAAAFSRLANTRGTMLIETPPRGAKGKVYDIYQQSLNQTEEERKEGQFEIFKIPAEEAVKEGLISQEFLDAEKIRLGPLYPQYYGAEFIAATGDLFDYDSILACENRGNTFGIPIDELNRTPIDYSTIKALAWDAGFGSSHYAIYALEWIPATKLNLQDNRAGILRVIYGKEYSRAIYGNMIKEILRVNDLIRPRKLLGDAANPEIIRDIKIAIGESKDYESLVERARQQKRPVEEYMQVVPLAGNPLGPDMNLHARAWVESGLLAIHPTYTDLIDQMKSVITKPNGQFDKSLAQYDSLDSFKFACWYFKFSEASGARTHSFKF